MEKDILIGKIGSVDASYGLIVPKNKEIFNLLERFDKIAIRSTRTSETIIADYVGIENSCLKIMWAGTFFDIKGTFKNVHEDSLSILPALSADCFLIKRNAFFCTTLAEREVKKGNLEKALLFMDQAIKLKPGKFMYSDKGDIYKKLENYDKAIEMYLESRKLGNDWDWLLYDIGFCFYKKGDADNALKFLPNEGSIKSSKLRGDLFFEKGEYDKAIDEYEEIIQIYYSHYAEHEDLQSAYKNIGKCFFMKGEYTQNK